MTSLVKAHEFFGQMQAADSAFRLINSNIGSNENLLRGSFRKTDIRKGLSVHYSDVTNLCDLDTRTEAPPHLGIKLFFQGGVSASIGNIDIPMPRHQERKGWIPSATFFHQKEPELFHRHADAGDRVRKLTIKILPDWLESGYVFADPSTAGLSHFMAEKLAAQSWTPSRTLLALAEQVIRPPVLDPHLDRLYVESRVLGIVAEAFSLLLDSRDNAAAVTLNASERSRLRRAEDLLRDSTEALSLEVIAAQVGVSVNTLQRLFHAGHGMTVFNYIRVQRLERARLALESDGLSIAQAAYIAGYSSPANFATAFKRQYGFSPRQSRR